MQSVHCCANDSVKWQQNKDHSMQCTPQVHLHLGWTVRIVASMQFERNHILIKLLQPLNWDLHFCMNVFCPPHSRSWVQHWVESLLLVMVLHTEYTHICTWLCFKRWSQIILKKLSLNVAMWRYNPVWMHGNVCKWKQDKTKQTQEKNHTRKLKGTYQCCQSWQYWKAIDSVKDVEEELP